MPDVLGVCSALWIKNLTKLNKKFIGDRNSLNSIFSFLIELHKNAAMSPKTQTRRQKTRHLINDIVNDVESMYQEEQLRNSDGHLVTRNEKLEKSANKRNDIYIERSANFRERSDKEIFKMKSSL